MSWVQVLIVAGVAAITSFSGTAIYPFNWNLRDGLRPKWVYIQRTGFANMSTLTMINNRVVANPAVTITPTAAVSPTAEPTSSPTPTKKPKSKPKLRPTAVPSPTPKPTPKYTSEQIYRLIDKFAGQYGVDANLLRHIAVCESGFDPEATNLSYAGLFQFSPNTWEKYRKVLGAATDPELRLDAQEAVQTAAYVLSVNQTYIWPNCMP